MSYPSSIKNQKEIAQSKYAVVQELHNLGKYSKTKWILTSCQWHNQWNSLNEYLEKFHAKFVSGEFKIQAALTDSSFCVSNIKIELKNNSLEALDKIFTFQVAVNSIDSISNELAFG